MLSTDWRMARTRAAVMERRVRALQTAAAWRADATPAGAPEGVAA